MYSVSPSAPTDSAELWAADREIYASSDPTSVENWNIIHDTSAVSCAAVDLRPKAPKKKAPAPTNVPSVSRSASLQTVQPTPALQKQLSAPTPQSESKQEEVAPSPSKAPVVKTPTVTPKKGIMGMFAASASKPKATTTAVTPKTEDKESLLESTVPVASIHNTDLSPPKHITNDMDIDDTPSKAMESKTPSKLAKAKSSGQQTINFAKVDPSAARPPPLMIDTEKLAGSNEVEKNGESVESTPSSASPAKKSATTKSPKKSPAKSPKKSTAKSPTKSPKKSAAAKKSSQMDVDEEESDAVKASSEPKTLEDELMEDFDADSGSQKGLSKLKKNVVPEDDEFFDSDEDPFGEESVEVKAARAKKKDEDKQKARKEAAEARKKAREEAKAAEKAAEAELNAANGEEKKKRRRKRSTSPGPDGEEKEAPSPAVAEQRRRFEAYFGATPVTAGAALTNNDDDSTPAAVTYSSSVDIPKTRTKKIVEEEEFVNEKGYTVTRTVERTVEEEIPEEERAKLKHEAEEALKRRQAEDEARKVAEAKKAAAKTASPAASPATKAASPAPKKTSIASFFAKKN